MTTHDTTPSGRPERPQLRRATSPADLLALVPGVLGFHPQDSLVLVSLGGTGFSARVDLPSFDGAPFHGVDPDTFAEVTLTWEEVVREQGRYLAAAAAHQRGVDRVVLVLYTDDHALAERTGAVTREEFEKAGIEVRLCFRADGRRWFGLLGMTGPDGPPPADGTPYDLSSHAWTAEAVVDGRVAFASRAELASTLVSDDPDDELAVLVAVDAHMDRLYDVITGPGALGRPALDHAAKQALVAEGAWVRGRVTDAVAQGGRLSADDAGRLLFAITSIQVRDVAWSRMTRDDASAHVELWRDLTRRAPTEMRAAPAALLAFSAWLSGDGALAWCAVDRCREADPGYSLGGLVAQALDNAVPPSSWEPFDEADLPLWAG